MLLRDCPNVSSTLAGMRHQPPFQESLLQGLATLLVKKYFLMSDLKKQSYLLTALQSVCSHRQVGDWQWRRQLNAQIRLDAVYAKQRGHTPMQLEKQTKPNPRKYFSALLWTPKQLSKRRAVVMPASRAKITIKLYKDKWLICCKM